MRFGFVTCVQLGLECLEAIVSSGGHVDEIYTLVDELGQAKAGRVFLDEFAARCGANLHKIRHVSDSATLALMAEHDLDWLFIVGWSQVAQRATLEIPRLGCIGIHPTLLPVGRGRAPIPWTILNGLEETGVTMFKLDEGVDSGPIVDQVRVSVSPDETATTLYSKVAAAHCELIASAWPKLSKGDIELRAQDEACATYWAGRRPADGEISADMTVLEVDRLVRAVTRPYPGAFVRRQDCVVRIWSGSVVRSTSSVSEPVELLDGQYWPAEIEIVQAQGSASLA